MFAKHLFIALLGSFVLLNAGLAWSSDPAKSTEPMAVFIEADWCANCKVLGPKLRYACKGLEHKINFVNLDVTDDRRFFEAKQVVFKLGVPKLLKGVVTVGWVALFDRNGRQVGTIRQDMSVEEIRHALLSLAEGSI